MADENQGAGTNEATDNTDWKAKYEKMRQHSRDWESKAKANQSAADELEKLKANSQTEQQRAIERAEKAEKELSELKAREDRARIVSEVATETGLPSDVIAMLNGDDADALKEQVEKMRKLLPTYPTRTDDGGGAANKQSNADRFFGALFGDD